MQDQEPLRAGHLPPDQRRREGRPVGRVVRLAGAGRVRRHQGTRPALPQVLLGLLRRHRPRRTTPTSPARSASGCRASSAPASRTSSRCCRTCCRTSTHHHDGQSKRAVEFFESKIKDAMLFGDIKRAVASHTDVDPVQHRQQGRPPGGPGRHPAGLPQSPQRDAGLQRRPPAHRPHGALPGGQGQAGGVPARLTSQPPAPTGLQERDAYQFNRDEVVEAWSRPSARARRRRRSGSTGPRTTSP